jgi:hypothetical protein
MGAKQFDYYMFIDYSENFIGYMVVDKNVISEFLLKITKFAHYNNIKHKPAYIHSIKKTIEKNEILSFLLKSKIRKTTATPEIYSDILEFLKNHENCLIFISIDNKQYSNFEKLVKIIDGANTKVVRENELKKDSQEYRMSLVLDTMLNIERLKHKNSIG